MSSFAVGGSRATPNKGMNLTIREYSKVGTLR